jgi:hypothetical protein
MTQPTVAAGGDGNPAEASPAQAFEDIANETFGGDEEEEAQADVEEPEQPEAEAEEPTEDDLEAEAEAEELPPIDAPVSWDAEAKERFAKLPREDQEYLSKREGEREKFVQTKALEATRARETAPYRLV